MKPQGATFAKQVKLIKRIIVWAFFSILAASVLLNVFLLFHSSETARQNTALTAELAAGRQALADCQMQLDAASAQLKAYTEAPPADSVQTVTLAYQQAYPDLYVQRGETASPLDKAVYLTFDDGPSGNTSALLDILDEYEVKATFFIVGTEADDHPSVLKEIAKRGHTIGIHTDTHRYRTVYASVDAFLADFAAASQKVERLTGQKPSIFRFPGGSINAYNQFIYQPLIAEMLRRGYVFFDWNVSAEDAVSHTVSKTAIINAVMNGVASHDRSIVLLHDSDTHENTVLAVKELIETLRAQGYTFLPLDNTVPPVTFSYNKE